jgi:hypothetical protein
MRSRVTSIPEYLEQLPEDRRQALTTVRQRILDHLPAGYEETFSWGMISYQVPLSVYPDTYNKQPLMYAALASQKGHMAVYLCNVYMIPELKERLAAGFKAANKRLDMGASCVRFKKLADLPLDVIGEAIGATQMADFVQRAKDVRAGAR